MLTGYSSQKLLEHEHLAYHRSDQTPLTACIAMSAHRLHSIRIDDFFFCFFLFYGLLISSAQARVGPRARGKPRRVHRPPHGFISIAELLSASSNTPLTEKQRIADR